MWCDHPFSQKTRQQKEHWGWGLGVGHDRERQGWTKSERVGVGNIGFFS